MGPLMDLLIRGCCIWRAATGIHRDQPPERKRLRAAVRSRYLENSMLMSLKALNSKA